jgi:hypothetical protein
MGSGGLARYDYSIELRSSTGRGGRESLALDTSRVSVRAAFVPRRARFRQMRIYEAGAASRGRHGDLRERCLSRGGLIGGVMISIPYYYENLSMRQLPPASHEVFRNLRTLERTLTARTKSCSDLLPTGRRPFLEEALSGRVELEDLIGGSEASGSA